MKIITDILNKLYICFANKKVGLDSYGNKYYENTKTKKRFVKVNAKQKIRHSLRLINQYFLLGRI